MREFHETQAEADWFADEIAIDFPSMGAAVARIRKAFLWDDHRVPVSAQVRVSLHEATRGVTIPLDVPVRRTCLRCGGRGETWMEPCVWCAGTGEALAQHRVTLLVPAGVADGARFRFTVATPSAPPTHIEVRVAVR